MERRFRFARTVLCVWLLVMAAVLSALTGCAGKYETMQLTREETAGSEPETAASEETAALSLEDADGIILRNALPYLEELNFPTLAVGSNTVSVTAANATFTGLEIQARSRWR